MTIFHEITTGAQNDLQRATEIARSMVALYGMTDELGAVTYQKAPGPFMMQQGFVPQKEFSEDTARMIDLEVRKIIDARMESALETLQQRQDLLHLVAGKLLEKETIEGDEFLELVAMHRKEQTAASKEVHESH